MTDRTPRLQPPRLQPLTAFSLGDRRNAAGLLCDLDDTLTTDGRLPAESYDRIERLTDAGLKVCIVTGRPAGWCDLIARLWPIAGVVGENGALAFRRDGRKVVRWWAQDEATREANRARLAQALDAALAAVPGSKPAVDNPWRETDIALDFAEEVGPLDLAAAGRAKVAFEAAGATAKVSSIHVNAWFGAHDKQSTTLRWLGETFGIEAATARSRFAFVGDSPNDAPMFAAFEHSVGVANVARFALPPEQLPRYITRAESARGFVELADALLEARKS